MTATKPSRNGHLPINGLSLYYEVHGELRRSRTSPLLLIPGGFMSTDSMTSWVSAFAGERTVIVFDQQGHGRTPDTSRTMSHEQFADDAAALLRALNVERADVMGCCSARNRTLAVAGDLVSRRCVTNPRMWSFSTASGPVASCSEASHATSWSADSP